MDLLPEANDPAAFPTPKTFEKSSSRTREALVSSLTKLLQSFLLANWLTGEC